MPLSSCSCWLACCSAITQAFILLAVYTLVIAPA
jgi:hypothetical protein